MSVRPLLCLVVSMLGLAACAGGAEPQPLDLRSGDALLRAGDYDGAVSAYGAELEHASGARRAMTEEKLATARHLAARRHAALAIRAARGGDATLAERHLQLARRHGEHAVAVRRATAEVEPLLADLRRAQELAGEAESLLATDAARAFELSSDARRLQPLDPEIGRIHREATRRHNAEVAAGRATAAWARGDAEGAADELRGARVGGEPVPEAAALRREVQRSLLARARNGDAQAAAEAYQLALRFDLSSEVREELATWSARHHLTRAARLRERGLPTVAALVEREAKRLVPTARTPSLDEARETTRVLVGIVDLVDETGGRVDGRRLARELRDALADDDAGGALQPELGRVTAPTALRIEGRVTRSTVEHLNARESIRRVRHLAGKRAVANPQPDVWLAELEQVAAQLDRREVELESERDLLRRLEAIPFLDRPVVRRARRGELEYRTRIAEAESRIETLTREVERLEYAAANLREAIRNTPDELEEPVFEEHPLAVTTYDVLGSIAVEFEVWRGDDLLRGETLTGSHRHTETVSPAFPQGGVRADPDEAPTDAVVAELARQDLVALLARRVRSSAVDALLPLLDQARAAEARGEPDAAAERYARYLLATPEVASPERAAAATALRELVGLELLPTLGDTR